MGLYDEISVAEGNKVNIPPPKTLYQTNSLDSKMRDLSIDKNGVLRYDTDPDRVITGLEISMYGEDETEYHRKYVLAVVMNQIEAVWEKEDDGSYTEIYLNQGLRLAAQTMANRMRPLHRRNPQ